MQAINTLYDNQYYYIFNLQPQNIATLCHSAVAIAEKECPSLTDAAQNVSRQFTQTFTLFAACHQLYYLSEESICNLGQFY